MKRNENYPKYVQAMHLMDAGKSANYVVKHLKLGWHTLRLVRARYLSGGELALLQPFHCSHYDVDTKHRIMEDIEKNGISLSEASFKYDIPKWTINRWLISYRSFGKGGLSRKGSKCIMKKPRQRTEAELDELEMLRRRNEYLEAENALLKKVKALVEEREARLRATGRKPSKN